MASLEPEEELGLQEVEGAEASWSGKSQRRETLSLVSLASVGL